MLPSFIAAAIIATSGGSRVAVSFTLPTMNAADSSCYEGLTPLVDLDSLIAYGRTPGQTRRSLVRYRVRGMEGWTWTLVNLNAGNGDSIWVATKDVHANESCPSNFWIVSGAVMGVDGPPTAILPHGEEKLYDVAGREVRAPLRSGVYFRRAPGSIRGKVVVVR